MKIDLGHASDLKSAEGWDEVDEKVWKSPNPIVITFPYARGAYAALDVDDSSVYYEPECRVQLSFEGKRDDRYRRVLITTITNMEYEYMSIDAILAENQVETFSQRDISFSLVPLQKMTCIFKTKIPEMGHLWGGTERDVGDPPTRHSAFGSTT